MRTHYCGLVDETLLGRPVTLCGWVDTRRDHGGVIFIDLRDHEGVVQIVVDPDNAKAFAIASDVGYEYCLRVAGTVRRRVSVNDRIRTGAFEVLADTIEVLNAARDLPGSIDVENDTFKVHNPLDIAPVAPMPMLVAALGPVMLKIAGELADGTVLWMADERAIAEHIAPRITKAAEEAGKPKPRIVAGVPVCLCAPSEVDVARERANRILAEAEISPNYQRLLEHGQAKDIGDMAIVGDEDAILAGFRRYEEAGVTDLSMRLLPIGNTRDELVASKYRTREVVAELVKELR